MMNMGMVGLLVIELICHVVMSWSESMLSVISRQKLPIVIPTILHWLLSPFIRNESDAQQILYSEDGRPVLYDISHFISD